MKKYSIEYCRNIAINKNGICLSDVYIDTKHIMKWQCNKCNYIWETNFYNIKNISWCAKCSKNAKLSLDDCIKFVDTKNGKCLSVIYKNANEIMKWQCKNGHIWEAAFSSIRGGSWCHKCSTLSKRKYSLQDCISIAIKNNGRCLSGQYINKREYMTWECGNRHIWKAPLSALNNGRWCRLCVNDDKRLNINECIELAILNGGRCLSNTYTNNKEKLLWECKNGHTWQARYDSIKIKKYWCPLCSNTISRPQKEIYKYLQDIYPKLTIILNDMQTIKPKHLDIYIPELKLAIEYDGEYWHYSEWAIKDRSSIQRMRDKDKKCIELGIKLIRVRENDWMNNKGLELQIMIDIIDRNNNG